MREISYLEAIREALLQEMERDSAVFLMGEDIGLYGGAFGVTKGLVQRFGEERVRNTPMSESAITGIAAGCAIGGLRPVLEIMFMDFITLALDQLANHAAKFRYLSNGGITVPMVIRTPAGAGRGYGSTHSQSLESWLISIPGIKIVAPSNPRDAKGLLVSAIRDKDPVVFVENKLLYGVKGEVPAESYSASIGKANLLRKGTDLSIISYSRMAGLSVHAAEELGVSADIVDLRSLKPLDIKTITESVTRTGRVMIVEEGCITGGVGAEISAQIAEHALEYLDAPIMRVGGADIPIPCAPALEKCAVPDKESIMKKIRDLMQYGS
ncbi:MAG: alpha-ketoacid dehydrogenase subunit beta [archaeon]